MSLSLSGCGAWPSLGSHAVSVGEEKLRSGGEGHFVLDLFLNLGNWERKQCGTMP